MVESLSQRPIDAEAGWAGPEVGERKRGGGRGQFESRVPGGEERRAGCVRSWAARRSGLSGPGARFWEELR